MKNLWKVKELNFENFWKSELSEINVNLSNAVCNRLVKKTEKDGRIWLCEITK